MTETLLQPVAPSPEGNPMSGLDRVAELGLVDPNLLDRLGGMANPLPAFADRPKDEAPAATVGSEEQYLPHTELIGDISRTVGKFVLTHAEGRKASDAADQAHLASGLSALGNVLTRKGTAELMASRNSVIEATKNPLPIDAILAEHAARQEAIRRSADFTMLDNKKRKRRKYDDLLQDATDRADADQN